MDVIHVLTEDLDCIIEFILVLFVPFVVPFLLALVKVGAACEPVLLLDHDLATSIRHRDQSLLNLWLYCDQLSIFTNHEFSPSLLLPM